MLNYQKSIICCVLFAVVWVQLSKAGLSDIDKNNIKYLEKSLIRVKENKLIPEGGIDHFKSWDSWSGISGATKMRIKKNYDRELTKGTLEFDGGDCLDELAKLTYKALDDYINEQLKDIEKLFKGDQETVEAIKNVANKGHFLDYQAFFDKKSKDKNLFSKLLKFKSKKPKETVESEAERKLRTILPEYLSYIRSKEPLNEIHSDKN